MNVGVDFGQPVFKMTLTVFDADTEGDIFSSSERRNTGGLKTPIIALCQELESLFNGQELI